MNPVAPRAQGERSLHLELALVSLVLDLNPGVEGGERLNRGLKDRERRERCDICANDMIRRIERDGAVFPRIRYTVTICVFEMEQLQVCFVLEADAAVVDAHPHRRGEDRRGRELVVGRRDAQLEACRRRRAGGAGRERRVTSRGHGCEGHGHLTERDTEWDGDGRTRGRVKRTELRHKGVEEAATKRGLEG